jgi:hypothetical protein
LDIFLAVVFLAAGWGFRDTSSCPCEPGALSRPGDIGGGDIEIGTPSLRPVKTTTSHMAHGENSRGEPNPAPFMQPMPITKSPAALGKGTTSLPSPSKQPVKCAWSCLSTWDGIFMCQCMLSNARDSRALLPGHRATSRGWQAKNADVHPRTLARTGDKPSQDTRCASQRVHELCVRSWGILIECSGMRLVLVGYSIKSACPR